MSYPAVRLLQNTGKPGTWMTVEDILNNLKTVLVNSSSENVLAIAIVDSSGNQVTPAPLAATTATLSNVASSASSVTVLAANTSRKGVIIHNDSTAILYIKFAATASTSSFTIRLNPYDTYEMKTPLYTGIIDGIWASANGFSRVTELT